MTQAKRIFPNMSISLMSGKIGDTGIMTYAILQKICRKNIKISMASFWIFILTEKLKAIAELTAMRF